VCLPYGKTSLVAERLSSTSTVLAALLSASQQSSRGMSQQCVLHNRIHWAKFFMSKAGLISSPGRGRFVATEEGRKLLATNPDQINVALLMKQPSFREFYKSERQPASDRADVAFEGKGPGPKSSTVTPEEQIETAFQAVQSVLRADLLDRIAQNSASFFEQLIVDLLVAMGYGGSRKNAASQLGRSGETLRGSMGGYGSGRSGGRPTTESGLTLSLPKLLRDDLFRLGCTSYSSLVWTNTATGERVGSIGYEAHLGQESGRVRLYYMTTRQWDGVTMGGYGSGRSGGRPTVEDSLTLNLRRLFKDGWLKVEAWTSGTLRWTVVNTGREIASIGFQSEVREESGYVRLHWTSTDRRTGETRQCENRITLTTRPQPFGGRRWFFVCPRTGESATKLYLPSGAYTFACRKAYRLGYRSQRETPSDRSLSRAFALRGKIGGEGGIGGYILKPKWMHRRTFERAMEKIYRAEEIVDRHCDLLLERLRRSP
jgi:Mrr N-terminal domain